MLEQDERLMAAALALARLGRGRTGANPNVGCLLVREGRIVGRGWTQDGGRPHAEAAALAEAGEAARGATLYVTLEPCAHESRRGPACAASLLAAGVSRVVVAMEDPDPRTSGRGIELLRRGGVELRVGVLEAAARTELFGFAGRLAAGRAELVLKLALSLDGRLCMAGGESQWITGEVARLYVHQLRAEADLMLVGGGTLRADSPRLDHRLPGCRAPQPLRGVLTGGEVPDGWFAFPALEALDRFAAERGVNRILCEGGGRVAASLLAADRVDRLILQRAPILIGDGQGLEDFQPAALAETHGMWRLQERRPLGDDLLEVFSRNR